MKKLYSLLLLCMAACLVLWFVGCSNDQPSTVSGPASSDVTNTETGVTVNAADAVITESENNGMRTDLGCCLSPVVIFQSVTDTSVTLQICARATGAVGGLVLQWMELPVDNITCLSFLFPTTGVNQILLPTPLAPYQCVTVTITGLLCETEYIFRAFAVNGQGCGSAPSNRICATTDDCPEFLCLDLPAGVTCGLATSTALTINVCAGPSGAPAGFEVQIAQLSTPTMVCADFVFDEAVVPTLSFTGPAFQVGPNGCVNITIPDLICETPYVIRVRAALATNFDCPSPWTENLCCNTAACEGGPGPCVSTPSISCMDFSATTLTLNVCAGETGTRTGIWIQYFPLLNGAVCSDTMHWPTSGWLQVRPGPFNPNQCVSVTLNNLLPGVTYAIRAQAMFCQPFEVSLDLDGGALLRDGHGAGRRRDMRADLQLLADARGDLASHQSDDRRRHVHVHAAHAGVEPLDGGRQCAGGAGATDHRAGTERSGGRQCDRDRDLYGAGAGAARGPQPQYGLCGRQHAFGSTVAGGGGATGAL